MIKRELPIFLVVGCLTVVLDFMVYRCLTYFLMRDISLAKAIGFISGCIFAYFANRFLTFEQQNVRSGSLWRFTLVYAAGLIANVSINESILSYCDGSASLYAAFILATGISATLNFMGMKWFVFAHRSLVSSK